VLFRSEQRKMNEEGETLSRTISAEQRARLRDLRRKLAQAQRPLTAQQVFGDLAYREALIALGEEWRMQADIQRAERIAAVNAPGWPLATAWPGGTGGAETPPRPPPSQWPTPAALFLLPLRFYAEIRLPTILAHAQFPSRLVAARAASADTLVAVLPPTSAAGTPARAAVAGRRGLPGSRLARPARCPHATGAGGARPDRLLVLPLRPWPAAAAGRARLGQCGAELAGLFRRAQSAAARLSLRRQRRPGRGDRSPARATAAGAAVCGRLLAGWQRAAQVPGGKWRGLSVAGGGGGVRPVPPGPVRRSHRPGPLPRPSAPFHAGHVRLRAGQAAAFPRAGPAGAPAAPGSPRPAHPAAHLLGFRRPRDRAAAWLRRRRRLLSPRLQSLLPGWHPRTHAADPGRGRSLRVPPQPAGARRAGGRHRLRAASRRWACGLCGRHAAPTGLLPGATHTGLAGPGARRRARRPDPPPRTGSAGPVAVR